VQSVIDAGTGALVALLGGLISRRVGVIAGILAAVSPTLIILSSQLLTDTLFLFFFSVMLVCGALFLCGSRHALAAAAGLAGGLSAASPRRRRVLSCSCC